MKQISSLITTKPKAHSLPSSMGLTELGLGTKLDGNQIKKAQAYLTKRTNPDQTQTDLLTSIQSLTESNIEIKPKLGRIGDISRYTITCKDRDNLNKAYTKVYMTLVGLPISDIKQRLLMLSTLVQRQFGDSPEDLEVRINSTATQLQNYPVDIVLKAIDEVQKTERYFPSYSVFYKHILWRYEARKQFLFALDREEERFDAEENDKFAVEQGLD